MRQQAGTPAPEFEVTDIFGEEFSLRDFKGQKVLLSFYRYAACPFCNLRFHKINKKYLDFKKEGLAIISVFHSPSDSIIKNIQKHKPSFPIVPDPGLKLYELYGLRTSIWRFIKMLFRIRDLWQSIRLGLFKISPEGPLSMVPADFLIDEQGYIHKAYYGKDSGDHIPFHEIKKWLKESAPNHVDKIQLNY